MPALGCSAFSFSVAEVDAYDFAYAGFLHGYSVD